MEGLRADIIDGFASRVRAYQNAADALVHAAAEYLGLNLTDHRCLDIIERHGPMPAGDLARAAGLSAKTITTAIDRLERAGYARRVDDPLDRRRVLVAITEDGYRNGEEIYAPLVRDSRSMLEHYSAAELTLILGYLDRSRDLLATHTARLQAQAGASPSRSEPDAPRSSPARPADSVR